MTEPHISSSSSSCVGEKRKYARQEKMKDKLFGNKSSDGCCCAQLIPSISSSSSQSKETETKGNKKTKTEIIFYISFRNVLVKRKRYSRRRHDPGDVLHSKKHTQTRRKKV
jgi:hypothetical protein